jgi:DNA-binding IclR family transcriptional regulator
MPDSAETIAFIRDSFRSVWSLELLLLLKADPGRGWSSTELVERLRGSDSVVRQSVDSLVAAGLVLIENDGKARYAPASTDLKSLVEKAEQLYAKRPDAVRRLIVLSANDQLTAFADAFRLRKD